MNTPNKLDEIFARYFQEVGDALRSDQRRAIESVLDGHNSLCLMPTGGGKSLIYWVAGKALGGITLVISPLTALMDEQAGKLKQHGLNVVILHSGIDAKAQYAELISLYHEQKPDFIFVSPERMATDGFLEFVCRHIRQDLKLVVIDEAHCISQWGFDFRPFYKEIPYFLQSVFDNSPQPRILGLTATLNPKDIEEICRDFAIKSEHVFKSDTLLRHNIQLRVIHVENEDEKDRLFWAELEQHRGEKMLVYIDRKRGKRSVEELSAVAVHRGFAATFFHADLTSKEKQDIIRRFKTNDVMVVFATSAFGMGIDIPDIRGVVHYLLPESIEQYYQQIGRVGRDGKPAWASIYYSDKNVAVRKKDYIDKSFPTMDVIEKSFAQLTNSQVGRTTVNYFDEGDELQSAYHYLIRSQLIRVVCKGLQNLHDFKPAKSIKVAEFEKYHAATQRGLLITTAKKLNLGEAKIVQDLYRWIAERKIKAEHSPRKCLVIESLQAELPDAWKARIAEDIERKKQHRHLMFELLVRLLEDYTDSKSLHQEIGLYLGIDKFKLGRIHQTLAGVMVRSKSEVIIANILHDRGVPFEYERALKSSDGEQHAPDFTISWKGKTFFLEHLGMLDNAGYNWDWKNKEKWYRQNFPGQLLTTVESGNLSKDIEALVNKYFRI